MNRRRLLYVISQAPYSNSAGQEAIDAILIGASFDQQVSVLFLHDGVFQLKSHQRVESHQQIKSHQQENDIDDTQQDSEMSLKPFTKTYKALADFGVETCFVLSSSLEARGLSPADLIIEPIVVNEAKVSDLISQQHRVFTF